MFGNCTQTKVGSRTLITNTYDKYTTLTKSEYGNLYSIEYTYDELERMTSKDGSYWLEQYAYDKNGKISWMKASSNVYNDVVRTTTYEYDTLGRLIYSLEVDESGKTLRYVKNKYNNKNQLTECTFYDGSETQMQSYTYKSDGSIDTFTVTNGDKVANTYDSLKRISQKTVDHDSSGDTYRITVDTAYVNKGSENQTTGLVKSVRYGYANTDKSFTSGSKVRDYIYIYEYDNIGNISRAYYRTAGSDGHYTDHEVGRYFYDEQNQLVMEKVYDGNYTLLYEYDTYGNIREVRKYDSTDFEYPGEAFSYGTLVSIETYGYTDSSWKDLLTSYKGHSFEYDAIGNPTQYYNGETYYMSWDTRNLIYVYVTNNTSCQFDYDSKGQRISKKIGNQTYTYLYHGTKLMEYKKNNDYALSFFYDDDDQPLGFYFRSSQTGDQNSGRGAKYYYVRNAQGDVVQIRNYLNEAVANYHYDAWGKLLSITDANGNKQTFTNDTFSVDNASIAYINPIRYRGYVYDNETGFYYLNTRYYDPSLRRFINADGYVSTGHGILGNNMFAYCNNNPVMYSDPSGNLPDDRLLQNALSCKYGNGKFYMLGCYHNHHDGHDNPNPKEVVNITRELNDAMVENSLSYIQETSGTGNYNILYEFYNRAKDSGEWDLKDRWDLSSDKIYVYGTKTLRHDDIGNIHFGYISAQVFDSSIAHLGAGANQFFKGNYKLKWISTWFDDPRDYEMIDYGYKLFHTYGYSFPN